MTSILPVVERSLVEAAARGRRRRAAPAAALVALAAAALVVAVVVVARPHERPATPLRQATPTPTATPAPMATPDGPPVGAAAVVAQLAQTYEAFRRPPVRVRELGGPRRLVKYSAQARLLADQDGWRAYAIPAAFGSKPQLCTLVTNGRVGGEGCGSVPRPPGYSSTYIGHSRYVIAALLLPDDAVSARLTRLDGRVVTVPVQHNAAIFPPGTRARRYSWTDRAGKEHGKILDPRMQ